MTFPKPEPRKREKGRARRAETASQRRARERAVARDGYCRLYTPDTELRVQLWKMFGACQGQSEFAHLGDSRRFKTRGKDPDERHSAAGGVMLCSGHHRVGRCAYDRHTLVIEELTPERADGRLRFSTEGHAWEETR